MNQPYALIIEDDPKQGMIYQTALQQAGYRTELDEDGNRYRSLLDACQPDLVILDLHLPAAFGLEILSDIRVKCPNIVIAVVTADFIKAKLVTSEADHVLIKPISVASLLRLAESALRNRNLV